MNLGDISSHRLIIFKGFLFLLVGVAAGLGLLLEYPEWHVALLLGLCVWGFCRFYYFAFYVVEKYVDGQYRFSSLFSFVIYLMARGKPGRLK